MTNQVWLASVMLALAILPAAAQDARRVAPLPNQRTEQRLPRRLALVVGNAAYSSFPLANPVNDARAIAGTLKESAFFEVTEIENADLRTLGRAVDAFTSALRPGDVGLFYYSGHGIQIEGENYLVPVDFDAKDEADARYGAFSAQRVHDRMAGAGAALSIVILDACRDNPFRTTRGGSRGWAAMQTGKGSFIAFATAPGATASDNSKEKNGLFTTYLLQSLSRPGLRLGEVFDATTDAVYQASGGSQIPWVAKGFVGNFIFRDPALEDARAQAVQTEIEGLEEQLKAAEKARAQARTEQAKLDAERSRQAAQAKLDLQRTEQERLARDAARSREAEAERQRLMNEQEARAAEREKQRLDTEARLTELRKKASLPAGNPDLTVEQARARVAELSKQADATRRSIDAAKTDALKKLDKDYAVLFAAQTIVRDEFEPIADFQKRQAAAQKKRQELDNRYNSERADIEKQFTAQGETATLAISNELQDLWKRTFPRTVPVVWDRYDPDLQRLTVHAGMQSYRFAVPLAKARELGGRKSSLVLQTEVALAPLADATNVAPSVPGERSGISVQTEVALVPIPNTVRLMDPLSGDRFEIAAP